LFDINQNLNAFIHFGKDPKNFIIIFSLSFALFHAGGRIEVAGLAIASRFAEVPKINI
jgi:hypothetical protein